MDRATPVRIGVAETLDFAQPQALCDFVLEEAFSRTIGLHPLAIDDELRDSALSCSSDDFFGRPWCTFNIDFVERNVMEAEKALGFAAVSAPQS